MRCLAIAEALPGRAIFYVDPDSRWRRTLADHGVDWRQESHHAKSGEMLAAASGGEIGAALFDGYDFADAEMEAVTGSVFTAEIDDLFRPPRTRAVINPGLGADPARYSLPADHVLCGAEFALLGSAHGRLHKELQALPRTIADVTTVLVAMGARDAANATVVVLDALAKIRPDLKIAVVLGSGAPHLGAVRDRAAELNVELHNVELRVDVTDMAALYRQADFAIGGGGVSLLERLCCGLPSATVALADNQAGQVRVAAKAEATLDLGPVGRLTARAAAGSLRRLLDDPARRRRMSEAGFALVDGLGAGRAAERLEQLRRSI